jgi:hypothetical protein
MGALTSASNAQNIIVASCDGRLAENAALTAINRGEATYVEGLSSVNKSCFDGIRGIPHAWITLDGKHAIDQTMPNAQQLVYFGIAFPTRLVAQNWLRDDSLSLLVVLETAADAAEAQAALQILDLSALSKVNTPGAQAKSDTPKVGKSETVSRCAG